MADQTIPAIQNLRGNIGIGTASPDRKVVIEAGSGYPLKVNSTQDYMISLSRSGTEQWWLKAYSNGDFAIHENGVGDQLHIDAGGKVGLGTSAPAQKLHIKGDRLRIEESVNARHLDIIPAVSGSSHIFTSSTTGSGYTFQNSSGTIAILDANGSAFYQDLTIASSNLKLSSAHYVQFGSANARIQGSNGSNYLKFYTAGVERLVITNTEATFSGDLVVTGGLTINGTTTTIDTTNLLVEDKNIELGSVATPTDLTADGGGITLKGTTDYTINWSNSTNSWHFNQGITVDSGAVTFGNALQFFEAGNNNFISSEGTNAHLFIRNVGGGNTIIGGTTNENAIVVVPNGAVTLYHDNATRLSTTVDGISLSGNGYIDLPDNGRARFGGGSDLAIYHTTTGNHSYIDNITGDLFIRNNSNDCVIIGHNANKGLIYCPDGRVELRFNDVKKFETTSAGASFSGGLYISGNYTDAGNQLNIWCDSNGHGNVAVYDFTLKTGSNNSRTNTFKIDNNGKVGIGTASPDTPLEIEVPSAANTQTRCFHIDHNPTSNTGSGYLTIRSGTNAVSSASLEQVSSGGGSFYGTYSDTNLINHGTQTSGAYNNINFVTNDAIRMTVGGGSQAGNVGIGTTSPARTLSVASGSGIVSTFTSSTSEAKIFYKASGTSGDYHVGTGASGDNLILLAGTSERMRILSDGKVGIGTTTPSRTLHVYDSAGPTIKFERGTASNLEFTFGSTNASIASAGEIQFRANGGTTNKFIINNSQIQSNAKFLVNTNSGIDVHAGDSGNILLSGNSSATGTPDQFFLKHNLGNVELGNSRGHLNITSGNVGIGTANPSALHSDARNLVVGSGSGNQGITIYGGSSHSSNLYFADGTTGDQAYRGYVVYSHSSEKLFLGAGGGTHLTLTNGSNVGIGTSNPSVKLDVYNSSGWGGIDIDGTSGGELRLQKAGTTYLDIYASDAGSTGSVIKAQSSLQLSSNNGTAATHSIYLNSAGNVGIGTTGPTSKLQISTPAIGLDGMAITTLTTTLATTAIGAKLSFTGGSNTNNNILGGVSMGNTGEEFAGMYAMDGGSGGATHLGLFAGTSSAITEGIRILSDGKVGIGTTAPNRNLSIVGQIGIDNSASSPSAGMLIAPDGTSNKIYSRTANNVASAHPLDFYAGGTHTVRIASSGNVGIGTTGPTSKLHVNGQISSDAFGPWYSTSTYVYDSTNGTRYFWNLLGTMPAATGKGSIEYEAKDDENYPHFVKGTIAFGSFTGGGGYTFSVQHDQQTADYFNVQVRVDTSRRIWIRIPNCDWSHFFRFRVHDNAGTFTTNTSWSTGTTRYDTATTAVPPNSSSDILSGQNLRATNTSVTGSVPTYDQSHNFGRILARNRITSGNGAAGATAYGFNNGTNTGMYLNDYTSSPQKDQLNFSVDGARRFRLNEAGSFVDGNSYVANGYQFRTFQEWLATTGGSGYGFKFRNTADAVDSMTISSAGNVVAAGTIRGTSFLQTANTGSYFYAAEFGRSAINESNPDMYGSGDTLILGADANQPTLVIRDTEKVGIGTASPAEKLEVAGNIATRNGTTATKLNLYETYTDSYNYELTSLEHSGGYFQINTQDAGTGTASGIKLKTDSLTALSIAAGGLVTVESRNSASSTNILSVGGSNNGYMSVRHIEGKASNSNAYGPLYINYLSNNNVFIASGGGNVGIGTTSPNALLHVKSTGNGEIEVERASGALVNIQAQSAKGVIGTDSNHPLSLKTNAGERVHITSGGNVGINTTSPSQKLDVEGVIKQKVYTVAYLPTAGSSTAGARAFVSDSAYAFSSSYLGYQVSGGGSNFVPVYSDGNYWYIG